MAAALSECMIAPPGLIARLADDRVDVAAPLLARSLLLSDVDLITLIGKHGIGHARAIARRSRLNPAIGHLIRALEASAAVDQELELSSDNAPASPPATLADPDPGPPEEETRQRLRAMMRPDAPPRSDAELPADTTMFVKLRDAAFTGSDMFFQTALADALGMNVPAVRTITRSPGYASLIAALRALDLGEEQAFLIAASVFPGQFPDPQTIRMFIERYRGLDRSIAIEQVRHWKPERAADWAKRGADDGRRLTAARAASAPPAAERVRNL